MVALYEQIQMAESSFALRWHHERTRLWINWITLSMLHSPVLKTWTVWSIYYTAIVVYGAWSLTGRWVDGSTGIWSYAVHSMEVVGLEGANPHDWKGMCTADWCYWTYLVDVGLVHGGYNYEVTVCLRVHAVVFEMMSRLIVKGIIRSYSMRQRAAVKPSIGIISNCDVCGGLMFNA